MQCIFTYVLNTSGWQTLNLNAGACFQLLQGGAVSNL